jgi:uncharacterized membrane protein
MNPVAIVHLIVATIIMVSALPLVAGRVKMNPWYGVRIPEAFVSDQRWFEINRYGGRLLLFWGAALEATAIFGAFIKHENWVAYDWTALGVVLVGLVIVIVLIYSYARKTKAPNQSPDPVLSSGTSRAGHEPRHR